MRKKKHAEHVNHERWLVSYADFITLLFAFFVVMFSVSQVDNKKVGRFTEAFTKSLGIDLMPSPGANLLPGGDLAPPPAPSNSAKAPAAGYPQELTTLEAALSRDAQKNGDLRGLQLLRRKNELVIRLPEAVLFDSGDDALRDGARRMLRALAPRLLEQGVDIRIEGHTDDRPIYTERFRSNWHLSAARATSVIELLSQDGRIPQARLSAAGYGEYRPVATNLTDDGRRQNRRVDLVATISAPALAAEPKTEAPKPGPPKPQDAKPTEPKAKDGQPEGGKPHEGPAADAKHAAAAPHDGPHAEARHP